MYFSVPLLLILTKCSLLFAAFTNEWDTRQARIVGGHEAKPYSHPYMVSLQLRFLWVRMHICGGSLLSKNWVLTAGHCVKASWITRWLPLDVVAGAHDVDTFGPKAQVVSVAERITHPLYDGGIGPNDIAVLRTNTPFTFTNEIQPVNLPKSFKGKPDSLLLTGWGVLKTTVFFPALPGKLQETNVTYVPYDECYEAVEALREDNEDNPLDKDANICTGPLTGGIAGCNGDSGGPLIQYMTSQKYYDDDPTDDNNNENDDNYIKDDDDKLPVVLGIVSWGVSPCGQKGAPTVYTRVSHYLDFIQLYVKDKYD